MLTPSRPVPGPILSLGTSCMLTTFRTSRSEQWEPCHALQATAASRGPFVGFEGESFLWEQQTSNSKFPNHPYSFVSSNMLETSPGWGRDGHEM